MKRLFSLFAVAALVGLASAAMAGDYHVGQLLICSDCHIMHGSMAHDYPEANALTAQPDAGGPFNLLLRSSETTGVCLNCHDGRDDVIDVVGDTSAPPAHGRNAGALNVTTGHGYTNDTGYETTDGHTLWAPGAPPGYNNTINYFATTPRNQPGVDGLECTDCHSAHGSANFRNMRTSTSTTNLFRNKTVTYQIGTGDNTTDVVEAVKRGYSWDDVNYQERSQLVSKYGEWCQSCHTNFHGSPTDANIFGTVAGQIVRHPTAGFDLGSSNLTQLNLHTNKVKLMDETHTWNGSGTTMTPSCFTCHKSHGNKNGFGLIWFQDETTLGPDPAPTPGTVSEEGDGGKFRDLCRQCHTQGTFPIGNPTAISYP